MTALLPARLQPRLQNLPGRLQDHLPCTEHQNGMGFKSPLPNRWEPARSPANGGWLDECKVPVEQLASHWDNTAASMRRRD